MSLLAPLFLLGGLAVTLPILLHLRRRASVEPQPFPSLMFLAHVPVRTIKRRRLRDVGLLLARCTALLLAALLFARPTVSSTDADSGGATGEYVVVAVDRSFSMAPAAVSERLREELLTRVENPADQIAVIAFDETAKVVEDFGVGEPGRAARLMEELVPGPRGTRFDAVARAARRLLLEVPDGRDRRFVLLSDLQRRGWADRQRLGLGSEVEIEVVDLSRSRGGEPVDRPNAALQSIELERQEESGRERVVTRATVQATNGAERDLQATLLVDEREVARLEVAELGNEGIATIEFPPFTVDLEGAHRGEVRLEATEDVLSEDDRWRFALAPQDSVRVLIVRSAARRASNADLFLRRALESVPAPRMRTSTVRASALDAAELDRAQVVFVLDSLAELSMDSRSLLERFVQNGGGLFVALGPRSEEDGGTSASLAPPLDPQAGSRRDAHRLLIVEPQHPALSALAGGPASSGLGTTIVYRSVGLQEPGVTVDDANGVRFDGIGAEERPLVLARLDDGRPLLIEGSEGAGRIHWFGATLDRQWSDLVLQPGFVPWIDQTVRHLARYQPLRTDYRLGSVVPVRLDPASDWTVVAPDGERSDAIATATTVQAPSPGGEVETDGRRPREVALTVDQPGFWTIESEEAGREIRLAVNVDPLESDLRQLDTEEFAAAWLGGVPSEASEEPVDRVEAQGERTDDQLAWWLGAVLLAVVIGEGVLAIRRQRAGGELATGTAR